MKNSVSLTLAVILLISCASCFYGWEHDRSGYDDWDRGWYGDRDRGGYGDQDRGEHEERR